MGVEGVWIRVVPDCRGFTDTFKCSNCGSFVSVRAYDKECGFPYCPWCRCEMVGTVEEAAHD